MGDQNKRVDQKKNRDIQVFRAICEYIKNSGFSPKITDLVATVNSYEGLPNGLRNSVGRCTISDAVHRLEEIGLITTMRARGGRSEQRGAGALQVVDSRFEILISQDEARDRIELYYEKCMENST